MNKRVEILVDSIIEDISEITPFEGQDRFKDKLTARIEQFEKETIEDTRNVLIGAVMAAHV